MRRDIAKFDEYVDEHSCTVTRVVYNACDWRSVWSRRVEFDEKSIYLVLVEHDKGVRELLSRASRPVDLPNVTERGSKGLGGGGGTHGEICAHIRV